MRCPYCHKDNDRVTDTRAGRDGASIRRRRQCNLCGGRFTTYERVEMPLKVVKKDGTRVPFDRVKLKLGLEKACWKRPISERQIEEIISKVVAHLEGDVDSEVESNQIGELVMKHLRELDQVAYVRFASVYRQFQDADDFADELKAMRAEAETVDRLE